MPKIDIAHIHEQGQDMIIAPLDGTFGHKPTDQQQYTLAQIELAAHSAGLKGSAVVVWQSGKQFYFLGPKQWHAFLKSIDMRWVLANVNKSLSW